MIKLLLVEDESGTRNGLMKHLKWNELGVDVVEEAIDGVEGLEAARRMHPDIVVSDIRMPGMNGIEFTSHVRKEFPECKIIYLSGYSDVEYLKAAIRNNAVSYVEKPIIIEELQEVIAKAVQLCMETNKMKETVDHIHMALSGSLPFIRQNIVNGLIVNQIDEAELKRNLNLAGVRFNPNDQYTASIVVPTFQEDESSDAKQRCCNAIIDFLHHASDGFTHLAVLKDSSQVVVITAHQPERRNDLGEIYRRLSGHLKEIEWAGSGLSWVVGSSSPELSGVNGSYRLAAGFLNDLFYYDYGDLFYASNRTSSLSTMSDEIIPSYAVLLQDLQKDEIMPFIEQLYQDMKTKAGTPVDEVKNLFYQMLRMLVEQGEKRGLPFSGSGPQKEQYDWVMMSRIGTLKQLKDYFLSKAANILDHFDTTDSNNQAVLDVIKYIRGNYSDKEISVQLLAEHIHLTPTYLSALFKKETGKTISEFITEVRIEKSANLLMEPQSKLYDVADQSGYSDANYFAKAFKKIKGMTPSQFRSKHKS
ncbi:response regulator [Paenibacillus silvisoli]|uniref:response regulator n=1 Tax=Paenibacillus silvisoli TaxID=3110539 RepID=UPI002804F641|nr:response regulator [Paenibacillus silvisoli]